MSHVGYDLFPNNFKGSYSINRRGYLTSMNIGQSDITQTIKDDFDIKTLFLDYLGSIFIMELKIHSTLGISSPPPH